MPVEGIEDIPCMSNKDSKHSQHSQPIEVIEPISLHWFLNAQWVYIPLLFLAIMCLGYHGHPHFHQEERYIRNPSFPT